MSLTATPTPSTFASPATPDLPAEADVPEFEIKPAKGWVAVNWQELIHYRELLYFLIWRDIKVRYKQTVLGASWAILQPLITMGIMTLVFGHMANLKDSMPAELKSVPYSLFVFAGVLPWMYFSTGVSTGGMALLNQQNLLTKVYFPRLFVPASTIGVAFFDAMISFCVMLVLMAIYRFVPPWQIVFLPLLAIVTTLLSLGIAFMLSSLTVTYRDFRFLVPFMVQTLMWVSAVGYPMHFKKDWINWVLRCNPVYSIIDGFRSALLGQHWDFAGLGIALAETVICVIFGMYYFKKTERRFADIA